MTVRPVFLLSMPRSGSTLLQSILSAHPHVATAPEPWFLLSLAALQGDGETHARHNADFARRAFSDLERVANERGGSINHAIRAFTMEVYGQLGDHDTRYFVDKTPRYSVIAQWIRELFPEAAFIVLWRDPRDIIASIIRTWGGGRWNTFLYEYDLFAGAESLAHFVAENPSALAISYEDLVINPAVTLKTIDEYLDFETPLVQMAPDGANLEQVVGVMGDPTGIQRYGSAMSTESVGGWQSAFQGRIRARWLTRYVRDVFPADHPGVPYSADAMVAEIEANISKLADDPTDAALVPLTRVWPKVNRASGYTAEETVRSFYERLKNRDVT